MKMKYFAGLPIAFMLVGQAFGGVFTTTVNCGNFTTSQAPNQTPTGTTNINSLSCGADNFSGIAGLSSVSGFVVLDNDFSGAQGLPATTTTTFLSTANWFSVNPITLTSSTSDNITETFNCGNGGTYGSAYALNGVAVFTGCNTSGNEPLGSSLLQSGNEGAFTINFTNSIASGTVGAATGYAQVVYTYTTTSAAPEPVSMILFGSGLLAVSLVGRKKFFVRK
jgi:hypothetical protein